MQLKSFIYERLSPVAPDSKKEGKKVSGKRFFAEKGQYY
jgi:hypothetical protein